MLSLAAIRFRTAAREAARNRDWITAVKSYQAYLVRKPNDVKALVQYGHATREAGDIEAAVAAYGRALDITPQAAEIWFHLSHACKRLGDRSAAIDCCARAAELDPTFAKATEELLALGARDRLPFGTAVDGASATATPSGGHIDHVPFGSGVYPPSRYDAFRQQVSIPAPPRPVSIANEEARPTMVLIDARSALPVEVRATLSSLLDQVDDRWQAIVYAPAVISSHSVASLAAIDPRIRFVAVDTPLPGVADAPHVLLVRAGDMLDRQALAWFSFAAIRTDCVAAYCDHDRAVDDWRTGRTFMQPAFQPMYDPEWFSDTDNSPALLFVVRTRLPLFDWPWGGSCQILHEAAAIGAVVHLPLLLASRKILAAQADQALTDPPGPATDLADPTPARDRQIANQPPQAIQIIVQTRDEPAMLKAAVDTLRHRAARADLLEITIVDNRSVEPATARLLDRWQRGKVATTLPLDEPFNWSRANNLGVEIGTAPLLLFLNNDTEMLSAGWDDMLRDALSADDVGIVGATLLYPDHSIQHAGVVMGMGGGGPIHEGVGRRIEAGPGDRWRKPRSAAAVTGAFMAMRRSVFSEVGGFDALQFAIAFNDIDLCLRVRTAGFRIVMASQILVIHHESKTRGLNTTRSQVAWDLDELGRMHDRWGSALFDDPAYNPHWTHVGQPFDGYRIPTMQEVLHRIDLAAQPTPWIPVIGAEDPV
ncbi:glycosyltransferase [Sphingomonas sp. Leaf242]|uniref:glycosyltransferase n=1 Tax=Sphingomonas sp. Leaf242 TaxID=1736304 RepID=UPI0009EC3A32|nr:glycosyltransferase [Sphingomonas sp. Leaf242]